MDLRELPREPFVRHPWEVARARFFVRKVLEHAPPRPIRVLDVGAGDGFLAAELLRALPDGSKVECVDPNYTDLQLGALSGQVPGVTFTRVASSTDFDFILLLDVIEHVPDDRAFLAEIAGRRLGPRGLALVSVPAYGSLFTRHDVSLGHHRRYRPRDLAWVLASSGLAEVEAGSLFTSLLVPRFLSKVAERLQGVRSVPSADPPPAHATTDAASWTLGTAPTAVVEWLLERDVALGAALGRRGLRPPGLSTWAIARKS